MKINQKCKILSLAVILVFAGLGAEQLLAGSAGTDAGIGGSRPARSGSGGIFFDGVDPASKPVMQKAKEDIERIRKGDFTIQLVDQNDRPVSGQAEIKLVHHEFQFGANLVLVALRKDRALREKAFQIVNELFSLVRVGSYWREAQKAIGAAPDWQFSDSLIQWAREHEKQMRFHCLFFLLPAAMPEWSRDIHTQAEWWPLIEYRIETVANKYGGVIDEYDVINEMISQFRRAGKHYPNFPNLADPANARRIFTITRKYLPDAKLIILDYILAKKTNRFFDQLFQYYEQLLEINTPIDAIGYQGHYYSDGATPFQKGHRHLGPDAYSMKSINEEFENLAKLGKPVHITEFNAPSRKKQFGASQPFLTDEEIAAWEVNYYTLAFSKPYIHQLVRWHIIDGWSYGLDAGFLKTDGAIKPNYYAIKKLLKQTWSTNWSGTIKGGSASLRGFYGKYYVKVNGYKPVELVFHSGDSTHKKIILVPK